MAPTDPVHVLVVDDDRNVQRMLADALSRAGFRVTVERDGEAALAAFERQPFDVVLLDVLLPALNGYEVARRIKSTPRGEETPVLMLSGIYKTKLHQAQALEKHGAAGFVEKPFKLNQLFGKLQGLLGDRFPTPPAPSPQGTPEPASEPLADPRAQAEASLVESADAESGGEETTEDAPEETTPGPRGALSMGRGSFASRAFPEILADLHRQRATGGLLLRRDKVKKIVFVRGGAPESVKSNRLSECLGRVMVRERMISEADCEESLKRMKASGRQQGTVLIEMGCISPHNLRYALELQLRLKLLEVFGWTRGEFSILELVSPTDVGGHGDTLDLGVIDEAWAQVDDHIEQAMRPAMMTRDAQLWVVSAAGTPKSAFFRGKVEDGRSRARAGATDTSCYVGYSFADDEDPADPEVWRRRMPALGITVTEDVVKADLDIMDFAEFRRAYGCQWPDVANPGWDVIAEDAWNRTAARRPVAL